MPETAPRPTQVTIAAWLVMTGSVFVVLTAFDQIAAHALARDPRGGRGLPQQAAGRGPRPGCPGDAQRDAGADHGHGRLRDGGGDPGLPGPATVPVGAARAHRARRAAVPGRAWWSAASCPPSSSAPSSCSGSSRPGTGSTARRPGSSRQYRCCRRHRWSCRPPTSRPPRAVRGPTPGSASRRAARSTGRPRRDHRSTSRRRRLARLGLPRWCGRARSPGRAPRSCSW